MTLHGHVESKPTVRGVVLQQVRNVVNVRVDVVHSDKIEHTSLQIDARDGAPDSPESVDPNAHSRSPGCARRLFRIAAEVHLGTNPEGGDDRWSTVSSYGCTMCRGGSPRATRTMFAATFSSMRN
jgi:hypothetical protein